MATTWISPWSWHLITAEELISEVALAAVSRMYVFSTIGLPEPEITIEADSVVINSPKIDYNYVIYFPKDLYEEMTNSFNSILSSLQREYGIYFGAADLKKTGGEHLGEMLRNFKSLERLLRTVSARHCWDERKVLALHGLLPSQFLSSLKSELSNANINYFITLPLNDEIGSGVFRTLELEEARILESDLKADRPGVIEKIFDLAENYGPHTWFCSYFSEVAL